jgi:hypothetical protein
MVKFINYQEKQYPVRVSYWAMKALKEKSGKRFEEIDEDVALYEPLFFAALQAGAWEMNQELKIKEEDVPKVLDACFFEFISFIPEFFQKEPSLQKIGGQAPKNVKQPVKELKK